MQLEFKNIDGVEIRSSGCRQLDKRQTPEELYATSCQQLLNYRKMNMHFNFNK